MQITISSEKLAEMRFLAERILDIVSKIEQSNAESTFKWAKSKMTAKFIKWYKANHFYTADTIKKLKKAMGD